MHSLLILKLEHLANQSKVYAILVIPVAGGPRGTGDDGREIREAQEGEGDV